MIQARLTLFQVITIVEREENWIQLQETKNRKIFKCWSERETRGQLLFTPVGFIQRQSETSLIFGQDVVL